MSLTELPQSAIHSIKKDSSCVLQLFPNVSQRNKVFKNSIPTNISDLLIYSWPCILRDFKLCVISEGVQNHYTLFYSGVILHSVSAFAPSCMLKIKK